MSVASDIQRQKDRGYVEVPCIGFGCNVVMHWYVTNPLRPRAHPRGFTHCAFCAAHTANLRFPDLRVYRRRRAS